MSAKSKRYQIATLNYPIVVSCAIMTAAVIGIFHLLNDEKEHTRQNSADSNQPMIHSVVPSRKLRKVTSTGERSNLLSPTPKISPKPRHEIQDDVARIIAAKGPREAAEQVRQSYGNSREEQRSALSVVAEQWSEKDSPAAWTWIQDTLEQENWSGDHPEADLWQSAVGGYIEGVADDDPETAAIAATYLETVTRFPGGNSQNLVSLPGENGDPTPPVVAQDPEAPEPTPGDFTKEVRQIAFPGDPGHPADEDYLAAPAK